jgi:hypothetical protein
VEEKSAIAINDSLCNRIDFFGHRTRQLHVNFSERIFFNIFINTIPFLARSPEIQIQQNKWNCHND